MEKNYFSQNINILVGKSGLTQDEFGELLGLKRGAINNYVNNKAFPKIETLLNICSEYKLALDDLIRKPLTDFSNVKEPGISSENEVPLGFVLISEKHLKLLESTIEDKNKIIKALEYRLGEADKSDTA